MDGLLRLHPAIFTSAKGQATFHAPLTNSIVLARGAGSPTFTRATTATVTDWESIVRNVLSGEVRFKGARRVQNLRTLNTDSLTSFTASNATVTTGVSDPNGGTSAITLTATGANGSLFVSFALAAGATGITSLWIRRRTGTGAIKLKNPDNTTTTITSQVTSAWQRFASSATANDGSGGNAGVEGLISGDAIDLYGVMIENVTGQSNQNPSEYVSNGVLSAPYHGAGVDGVQYFTTQKGNMVASNVVTEATGATISSSTLLGYLAEEQRTNLCLQSADLSNAAWSTAGATTVGSPTVGPDGQTVAQKLAENSTSGSNYGRFQSFTKAASALPYTFSAYLKQAEDTWAYFLIDDGTSTNGISAWINLATGALGTVGKGGYTNPLSGASSAVVQAANGFWRFSVTATSTTGTALRAGINTATADNQPTHTGVIGNGIYAWGAQLEQAAFATSYIPTTTTSVTRNTDSLSYQYSGNFSDTAGTAYAEINLPNTETTQAGIVGIGATTTLLSAHNVDGRPVMYDGTTLGYGSASAIPGGTTKQASKWNSGASSMTRYQNGVTGTPVSYGGSFTPVAIYIGTISTATTPLNGTIRNVKIWTRALSDAQIAAL